MEKATVTKFIVAGVIIIAALMAAYVFKI